MSKRAKRVKMSIAVKAASVAIALVLFGAPVAAQEAEPEPTTPAAPAPEPAPEPAPAPAEGEAPAPEPEPAPAPAEGEAPAPAPADGETPAEGEAPVDPNLPVPENDDPLADEGEGEEAPAEDVPVPRSGRYANQPDFEPPTVQWGNVRDAENRLAIAIEEHADAVNQVRSLRISEKGLRVKLKDLGEEAQETIAKLEAAENRLRARALNAFTSADTSTASVSALDHDDLLEARSQQFLVETAFKVDQATIEEIIRLKGDLNDQSLEAFDRLSRVVETINRMQLVVVELAGVIEQAELEVEVFKAGSEFFVADLVFPVYEPYDEVLIDSWGYPRAPGTPDEHWHEGIDIFAPEGTPIVAAERGVATKVGTAKLGGLRVWVQGESGTKWYYSHMSAIAEGLEVGDVVEVGDLLGYIGHSGNAVGTPDHLHLQVHPDGGRPVNPYPILKVISDHERAEAAALEAKLAEEERRADEESDSDTDPVQNLGEFGPLEDRAEGEGIEDNVADGWDAPVGFGNILN